MAVEYVKTFCTLISYQRKVGDRFIFWSFLIVISNERAHCGPSRLIILQILAVYFLY